LSKREFGWKTASIFGIVVGLVSGIAFVGAYGLSVIEIPGVTSYIKGTISSGYIAGLLFGIAVGISGWLIGNSVGGVMGGIILGIIVGIMTHEYIAQDLRKNHFERWVL
jgi:hypothetical protein